GDHRVDVAAEVLAPAGRDGGIDDRRRGGRGRGGGGGGGRGQRGGRRGHQAGQGHRGDVVGGVPRARRPRRGHQEQPADEEHHDGRRARPTECPTEVHAQYRPSTTATTACDLSAFGFDSALRNPLSPDGRLPR